MLKAAYAEGSVPNLFFWRDSSGQEIDFLIEKGGALQRAIEVKASSTFHPKFFSTLNHLGDAFDIPVEAREVVYSGNESITTKHGTLRAFADLR